MKETEEAQIGELLGAYGYRILQPLFEDSKRNAGVWLVLYHPTGSLRVAKRIFPTSPKLALLRTWAAYTEEGLVRIYDILQDGRQCCFIMEYVEGESLNQYRIGLSENGQQLSKRKIIKWGMELCDILTFLHEQHPSVLYQDLKPSNIMLDKEGRLKLIDPDSAGFAGASSEIVGTPGFSAPEQQCGQVDERTDLYALGRTLQWMLEGSDCEKKGVLLQQIFLKCTAKEPKQRFQSSQEVKKALRKISYMPKILPIFLTAILLALMILSSRRIIFLKLENGEILYQNYLSQNDISDYKSAIFLFPDREEGYQKFLNFILQDGRFDRQEHQELTALLYYTENHLKENPRGYCRFLYRLGKCYDSFYSEDGAKNYANAWMEKAETMRKQENLEKELTEFSKEELIEWK